ncbi:MAG TPA: tetratricopeptide repeat protein [bacterium]
MKKRWLSVLLLAVLFVGCPPTRKNATKIYITQNQYEKAKEQCLLGIEEAPADFEYRCLLGQIEIQLGNSQAGSKAFQNAFKIDTALTMKWFTVTEKNNLTAYWGTFIKVASELLLEKKYDEALVNLQLARKLDPTAAQQFIIEGHVRTEMGDKEGATAAYNRALSIDPENPEAYFSIAGTMFEKKDYEKAIDQFSNAIKYFIKRYDQQKGGLFQNVAFDRAVANEIVTLYNDKKEEELNRVLKTKLGIEQPEAQKRNVERFAITTEYLGMSYYHRGISNYNLKKDSLALNDWNATLEIQPNNLNAMFSVAEILVKFKKYDEARSYYEKIITLKGDDFAAWFMIAVCYSQVKNFQKAIEIYEDKALKLEPKNIDVLTNLAYAYRELKNTKKSLEYLMMIQELEKGK